MPAATTNNGEAPGREAGAFFLFDTALGRCALVWRGAAIGGASLPERDGAAMRGSLSRRFPGSDEAEPPPFVRAAADRVARHFSGDAQDFSDLPLDFQQASAFERAVYAAALAIPCGETRTYGDLARALGQPQAGQAVGVALGRNPVPILVPCHRILAGGRRPGGFSAPGGVATKFRILEIERAKLPGEGASLFGELPLAVRPSR
ncbi:MAG TPA: methylated-DNA--[protein]-cysteine S-methyltransferase [Allosphingosinicella sp.]|nr:methylated-DNA--[protein]-cysteine S-methyltransferase [Allosphingosinicella sp.]